MSPKTSFIRVSDESHTGLDQAPLEFVRFVIIDIMTLPSKEYQPKKAEPLAKNDSYAISQNICPVFSLVTTMGSRAKKMPTGARKMKTCILRFIFLTSLCLHFSCLHFLDEIRQV